MSRSRGFHILGATPERLNAFSDGVFAIAITLLVLEIKVPTLGPGESPSQLPAKVLQQLPNLSSYVISFLVIGLYWISHHRFFHYIRRVDSTALWLNLIFLMFISFQPYPTALLGEYGADGFIVAFYAGSQVLCSLSKVWLWYYATRDHRLVDPDINPALVNYLTMKGLAGAAVFLLSIGLASFNGMVGFYSWLLLPPLNILLPRFFQTDEDKLEVSEAVG